MSVVFSPRWTHYSWSRSRNIDEESERQLILEMIRNCDNDVIRQYAESGTGGQVYVRTGLHASRSDSRDHVQLQLGDSTSGNWVSSAWPGYTAHIVYNGSRTMQYEATLVVGLHSGGD